MCITVCMLKSVEILQGQLLSLLCMFWNQTWVLVFALLDGWHLFSTDWSWQLLNLVLTFKNLSPYVLLCMHTLWLYKWIWGDHSYPLSVAVFLASTMRKQYIWNSGWGAWLQKHVETRHIALKTENREERDECCCSVLFLLFVSSVTPAHGIGLPIFKMDLPISIVT